MKIGGIGEIGVCFNIGNKHPIYTKEIPNGIYHDQILKACLFKNTDVIVTFRNIRFVYLRIW